MSINFRALADAAPSDLQAEPESGAGEAPPSCSYCGANEFDSVEDNGRVARATCTACGGTMVSHDGGYWQPDLIGQQDNHPKPNPDPNTGGVPGVWAPILRSEDVTRHTTAAADWCRHRHAERCWLPKDATNGQVALYVPQDRGACPWTTASQQQINCPVSEPGPMAGMTRMAYGLVDNPTLMPVKHAGYKGFVEAYPGHEREMRDMDREFETGHYNHHGHEFDEDAWDDSAPEPHPHEQAHYEEHGEYPESYDERHEQAYGEHMQRKAEAEEPIGHHAALINFVHNHGANTALWHRHAQIEDVHHHQPPIATQPYVVKEHLDRYRVDRNGPTERVHEFGTHVDDYLGDHHPMIVRHNGEHFVTEGHHRTASDLAAGRPTRAWVWDADKHGLPGGDDDSYEVEHEHMTKYAKKIRCDYRHKDPKKAAAHALYNHDDGVCVATERKRGREQRHPKKAVMDSELGFHLTASWADVRNKAKRIRSEGGVHIVVASGDGVGANVQGDTGVYETVLSYLPGSYKVANWECGCAWAAFAFDRSPAFKRFEGRMCSHALALQFEAQARGMFGREVTEDVTRPGWLRDRARQRYLPDTGGHVEVAASLGPDLVHPPVYALAIEALAAGYDPAEALRSMLDAGMPHAGAQQLLHEALSDPASVPVPGTVAGLSGDLRGDLRTMGSMDDDVWWHGTATGDLRGGAYGLHVGTHRAATEAVTARIGHPVEGSWDGGREYGKTLLAGKKTLHERGIYPTGHNMGVPEHDHYPDPRGHFPHDSHVTMESKPDIFPLRIVGEMGNTPDRPHRDDQANAAMQRSRGRGHEGGLGYYYRNVGEDGGSVSAVLPHSSHIERIGRNHPGVDYQSANRHHRPLTDADYGFHDGDEDEDEDDWHHYGAKTEPDDGPTHAGLVLKAQDTGRVLMLQRSHRDETDPARGTWEFPGGGIEHGDSTSLHGAAREFAEEIGQPVPHGGTLQHVWRSGPYVGHVLVIPSEDHITLHDGRVVPNPDDPDGDDAEQAAWWDPDHARKNPALREECRSSPWKAIKEASRGKTADFSAHDPLGDFQPDPPAQRPDTKPGDQENPGSTGFATAADPPAFDAADARSMRMPEMSSWGSYSRGDFLRRIVEQYDQPHQRPPLAGGEWPTLGDLWDTAMDLHRQANGEATLHEEPEPALPSTDGAEDTLVDPAHQHIPLDDTLARPDPRDTMQPEINPLEMLTPNQVHASVDDIVAAFQATAGARSLVAPSQRSRKGEPSDADIASAAAAHLAKTALKDFNALEQAELIGEGGSSTRARNFGDLKIEGTHYEALDEALADQEKISDTEVIFI